MRDGLPPGGAESGRGPEEDGNEIGREKKDSRRGPEENGTATGREKTDSGREPEGRKIGGVPEDKENARQIYARLVLHIEYFSVPRACWRLF